MSVSSGQDLYFPETEGGPAPLNVLFVGDSPDDLGSILLALRGAGFAAAGQRVASAEEMRSALHQGSWDAILAEDLPPDYDAHSALSVAKQSGLDLPFIVVLRRMEEEQAARLMEAGADDCLLHGAFARLALALKRELRNAAIRRAHRVHAFQERRMHTPSGPPGATGQEHRRDEQQESLELERDSLLRRPQLQIDRMPFVYALFDTDFRIIDWNPAAERVFGYRKEEMLGVGPPFEQFVPRECFPAAEEIRRRIRHGDMAAHSINDNLTKDGRVIVCEWFNTPLFEQGRFIGLLCLAQDITDRQSLEARFRQSQKMEAIGQLAGGIAHDFNNFLTALNIYCELLIEELRSEPASNLVQEIRDAAERSTTFTKQLLAFSRKQERAPRVLNLNEAVRETEMVLRRVIGEHVQLSVNLQPLLGSVNADPGELEQALLNLAVNARDAMPQGGMLTIATDNIDLDEAYAQSHPAVLPGPYVGLVVTDSGCGMSERVRQHLFEPFFTTKASGRGTGLGLAVVQSIVKQSGGHIEVESELRRGASFKLYFPRIDHVEPVCAAASAESGRRLQGSETILLVEDDHALRRVVKKALEEYGYQVLEAPTGDAAVQVAEQFAQPIHVLVTDVVMPGLGARELADHLRAAQPTMEVLYLSGYSDDTVFQHGVAQNDVAFLRKPFTFAALGNRIREVLDDVRAGG